MTHRSSDGLLSVDDLQTYPGNSLNPPRDILQSLARGVRLRCPACGIGRLFSQFLKLNATCRHCSEPLHHARPDDAPPYFVMIITGHLIVPIVAAVEELSNLPVWLSISIFASAACGIALALLPPVKGAIVALQWALWMHGFDPHEEGVRPSTGQSPSNAILPVCSEPAVNAQPALRHNEATEATK